MSFWPLTTGGSAIGRGASCLVHLESRFFVWSPSRPLYHMKRSKSLLGVKQWIFYRCFSLATEIYWIYRVICIIRRPLIRCSSGCQRFLHSPLFRAKVLQLTLIARRTRKPSYRSISRRSPTFLLESVSGSSDIPRNSVGGGSRIARIREAHYLTGPPNLRRLGLCDSDKFTPIFITFLTTL